MSATIAPIPLQETARKTSKVSFTWAKLIARIYEIDPLVCSCGKEMKIIKIVIDPAQIWRILKNIEWLIAAPDFDGPQDLTEWEICQLVPGTDDGFPDDRDQSYIYNSGPPPPATISWRLILRIGKIQITLYTNESSRSKLRGIKPEEIKSKNAVRERRIHNF